METDFYALGVHFIENAYLEITEKSRELEEKHGLAAKNQFLLGVASAMPKFEEFLGPDNSLDNLKIDFSDDYDNEDIKML